jgi:hypothetical protein
MELRRIERVNVEVLTVSKFGVRDRDKRDSTHQKWNVWWECGLFDLRHCRSKSQRRRRVWKETIDKLLPTMECL